MVSGMFQVQVVIISKFFFLCRCQRQISLYLQYSQPPHSSSPQRADRGPFRLWVLADPAVPADRECCRPWAPALPSRPWCRDTLPKRMWKWDGKKKQVMKTIALALDICTVGHISRSGMDSGGYALTSLVRVLRLSRGCIPLASKMSVACEGEREKFIRTEVQTAVNFHWFSWHKLITECKYLIIQSAATLLTNITIYTALIRAPSIALVQTHLSLLNAPPINLLNFIHFYQ